jgi:membrane-associated phospholipid phosphatase
VSVNLRCGDGNLKAVEETRATPAATPRAAGWRWPWLVPGGLVLLLAFLTVNVLADGPLAGTDRRIRDFVHPVATSPGWRWLGYGRLAPVQLVGDLGSTKIAAPVLVVCAVVVAVRFRSLWPLAIAAAGGALLAGTVIPGKILIGRPGPGYASLAPGAWGDFPSGHTSTAGVCYGLAVLLLTAGTQAAALRGAAGGRPPGLALRGAAGDQGLRRAAIAATATVCFLVGAAMVWCDYHWFTDVAAGWALSALIVWAVWEGQRRWAGGWQRRTDRPALTDGIEEHRAKEHTG